MRMPVLFVGHGSPMNAIEDNSYTTRPESIGQNSARTRGCLCCFGALGNFGKPRAYCEPSKDHS